MPESKAEVIVVTVIAVRVSKESRDPGYAHRITASNLTVTTLTRSKVGNLYGFMEDALKCIIFVHSQRVQNLSKPLYREYRI